MLVFQCAAHDWVWAYGSTAAMFMQISVVCASVSSLIDDDGPCCCRDHGVLCCHLRPWCFLGLYYCQGPYLATCPTADGFCVNVLSHVTIEGQVDASGLCCSPKSCYIHGLWCHQGPCWYEWPALLLRPCWCCWTVMPRRTICASCCNRGPCWCQQYVLPMETMLWSRDHVTVHGPCCHQKPYLSPWSVFLLTAKDKVANSAMVLMTVD